jgi:uncharacterized protein YbjT (DUF2867 family)
VILQAFTVAVTGASGFVGQNLVIELRARGLAVRALSRNPNKLEWARALGAEAVRADVFDASSLAAALAGVDAAYYLVHSMEPGVPSDYAGRDREAAQNFARAAKQAGVRRIIYLGGLGRTGLSRHLASRAEVGEILEAEGPPLTIIGAGIILGAGGASFQMLQDLTKRLPVMVTPRWVGTRTQPVALDDAINCLVGLLDHPETAGQRFDIGTPEVVTYAELMQTVAAISHHRSPLIVPVPVLTPRLSSYWVDFVTSVPHALARPLILGLSTEAVAERPDRLPALLGLRPTPLADAIALALGPEAADSETVLLVRGGTIRSVQRLSFPTNLRFERVGPNPCSASPEWLLSVYLVEVGRRTGGAIRSSRARGATRLDAVGRLPMIRLGQARFEPQPGTLGGAARVPIEGGALIRPDGASNPGMLTIRWWSQGRHLHVEAVLDVAYRPWLLGRRQLSNAVLARVHRYFSVRALRRLALELARPSLPLYSASQRRSRG